MIFEINLTYIYVMFFCILIFLIFLYYQNRIRFKNFQDFLHKNTDTKFEEINNNFSVIINEFKKIKEEQKDIYSLNKQLIDAVNELLNSHIKLLDIIQEIKLLIKDERMFEKELIKMKKIIERKNKNV